MSRQRSSLGRRAEEAAAELLVTQGYVLLERNWRCPLGEVDLIAREGDWLVFVEVRSKGSSAFGSPLESITGAKKERLRRLASWYLAGHPTSAACRFDVVGVEVLPGGRLRLELVRAAF